MVSVFVRRGLECLPGDVTHHADGDLLSDVPCLALTGQEGQQTSALYQSSDTLHSSPAISQHYSTESRTFLTSFLHIWWP